MKRLLHVQLITCIAAFTFSLYSILQDFYIYNKNCGTFLPINSNFTHPFYTPCFYGGFAFLLCLILAFLISRKPNISKQKYLVTLSIFGVSFAYSNMFLELKKYINAGMTTYKGCSGAVVQNPLVTPCFIGSLFFTLILVLSAYSYKKLKNS